MANHKATGKKAAKGPELTQRARGLILKVFDILEDEGKTLSQLLADKAREDPFKFMDLASKYTVKEFQGEVNHNNVTANDLTDDELADIATGSSTRTPEEKTSENKLH
jgi:hypothetical protein